MLTVLFLLEKIKREKLYFFKSASLHFSYVRKICILTKQAKELILVSWFGNCQSIKKVGGRRVGGLYQAVSSFRLACRNVIYKAKRELSLISGYSFDHAVIFRRRPQSRRRIEPNVKEENDAWKYHFKWRNSREKLERKVKTWMMDVAIQSLTKI